MFDDKATVGEQCIDYTVTLSEKTKLFIMLGMLLGIFLEATDQTIVATVVPAIVFEFQGINLLGWVLTAYLLTSTALVPVYGKLSDIYGRRTIILWGGSVFLLGSVLCGLANSMVQLIFFRVVQGIGASALTSTAFVIPADLYPPARRAYAMSLISGVFGVANIIGPFLGGLLTDNLGWRWAFYINVPVGIIALILIATKMPKFNSHRYEQINWWETVLLLLSIVPLLLGVTLDKSLYPWTSPLTLGLLAVSVIAGIFLLLVEQRVPTPLIPLALFRNRTFSITCIVVFLVGAAFLPVFLFLALFMVNVVSVSATSAGTALIPLTLGLVMSSTIASNVVQRTGRYKPTILFGFALITIAFLLLARLETTTTAWDVAWRSILLGFGIGAVGPQLSLAVQNAVPFNLVGMATASIQFFQQIGMTSGTAIAGSALSILLTIQLTTNLAPVIEQLPTEARHYVKIVQLRNGVVSSKGTTNSQIDLATQIETATGNRKLARAVEDAVKHSFAASITHVYFYALFLVLAAFLLILALPEIPLRTSK